ncbi:MAG: hypothetical protein KDA24_08730 [Deltaproteobacteria bacterium]|nr:hypothetical protein [Deltaproteobacteria bacterium]
MRTLLCLTGALALLVPATSFALDLPGGVSIPDDVGVQSAKGKKPKKNKKKKKNAEPETPPPPPPDGDGDGVIDADDKCVEEAEDIDMFEDEDGCPDPDNDADGINDDADGCPFEAENVDGWADEDGCPEKEAAIKPFTIEATLMDGTTVKGTVVRIVATDEDAPDSEPHEPTTVGIIVGDEAEFDTEWSNVKSLTSEKVNFVEGVDCYSEGVQELGEAPTWECTLKHPTVVKLGTSEHKGTHRVLDRKMHRLDFWIDGLECSGDSCEAVEKQRGLQWYLYKMLGFEKSEEENEAVAKLQKDLRETQKSQVKKATFKAIESPE